MREICRRYRHSGSSGIVYPTLKSLMDEGLVKYEISNNRKIYSLTPLGIACLNENREVMEKLRMKKASPTRLAGSASLTPLKKWKHRY
ncbi:MAG: helix-turn-helix transcriptional regulator [Candidatus Micrarchaeaceae archaeon]